MAMLATARAHPESFDISIRTTVVKLGKSSYLMPNNPDQIRLTCFYYPAFLVKQMVDPGLKGSMWVTILPTSGGRRPACGSSHDSGEWSLADDGWYFVGAKGMLCFLEASDGEDGAMLTRVVDTATQKKIFEDSVSFWHLRRLKSPMEFARTANGTLLMRYRRSVEAKCSLVKDGDACWDKVRNQFGLMKAPVPRCSGYQQRGEREWKVGDAGVPPEDEGTPSAIVYPVEVTFSGQPKVKVVSGAVWCSAAD
jgi:hypothetical protein